jgi:hypothetical protein
MKKIIRKLRWLALAHTLLERAAVNAKKPMRREETPASLVFQALLYAGFFRPSTVIISCASHSDIG